MRRSAQHEDVRAGAEDALLEAGDDDRVHLRMLEPDALDRVGELDVHAEVVRVQLQAIVGGQAGVLLHVHRQRGDRAIEGRASSGGSDRVTFRRRARGLRRDMQVSVQYAKRTLPRRLRAVATYGLQDAERTVGRVRARAASRRLVTVMSAAAGQCPSSSLTPAADVGRLGGRRRIRIATTRRGLVTAEAMLNLRRATSRWRPAQRREAPSSPLQENQGQRAVRFDSAFIMSHR